MTGPVARVVACAVGMAALAGGLASAGLGRGPGLAVRPASALPAHGEWPAGQAAAGGRAGLAGRAVRALPLRAGVSRLAGWQKGGLLGVSFARAADGWAVGVACVPDCNSGREDTLIVHWNGSRWSRQASPDLSPLEGLFSVSAVSAADAWAAGGYGTGSGAFRTLMLRWNGVAWSRVTSPDPSPDREYGLNVISAVTATSARNAWAVGYYCARRCQADGEVDRTLILHWNGVRWAVAASPDPGTGYSVLTGVTAVSATSAWAVGSYAAGTSVMRPLALHWNGIRWARAAIAQPRRGGRYRLLTGVTATSANSAWAAGYSCTANCSTQPDASQADRTLILHWNGTRWSPAPTPDPGARYDILNAISAASAGSGWAVGDFATSTGKIAPLVLRWNGHAWAHSPAPRSRADASLFAASASPNPPVWAVGYTCAAGSSCLAEFLHPLTLRWNGRSWTSP